jgi:hypothetical protein
VVGFLDHLHVCFFDESEPFVLRRRNWLVLEKLHLHGDLFRRNVHINLIFYFDDDKKI